MKDAEPEKLGSFKLYRPAGGDGWALSWGGAWLPGRYESRDAAVLACGYVLGGEGRGDLEVLRDLTGGRLIAVADVMGLPVTIQAVQWTGVNMAEVLEFTGHRGVCVNSFGDPCITVNGEVRAVETGQWIFRERDGSLHHCHEDVLKVLRGLERRW